MTDLDNRVPTDPMDEVCDLPLSSTQIGLLGLLEVAPDTTAYHMPVVMELDATLDVGRLQAAVDDAALRHESLRSVVAGRDPVPRHRVSRHGTVRVERVPVSPGADPVDALTTFALAPFALRDGPPLRIGWCPSSGPDGTLLAVSASHVLFDGASLQVLLDEIDQDYRGVLRAPGVALDAGDHALWREEQGVRPEDLQHWSTVLADAADHWPPRRSAVTRAPAVIADAGRVSRSLPPALVVRLDALARESGTTPMAVAAAAWSQALAEWSGERSVALLTPLGGRGLPEVERVVGNLTSVVPVRWDVAPEDPLVEVCRRAFAACGAAVGHPTVGLPDLVSALHPARAAGRESWSDVLFVFNELPPLATWCGAGARRIDIALRHAKSDLCLDVRREGATVTVCLDHRTDVLDPDDAERLLSRMLAALSGTRIEGTGPTAVIAGPGGSALDPTPPVVRRPGEDGAAPADLLEDLRRWAVELLPEAGRPIGDTEDLFAAGADSVALLRLVARARREGWQVEARQVFEDPTLLGLASGASPTADEHPTGSEAPVDQGTEGAPALPTMRPATPTERRMWLLERVGDLPPGAYAVPSVMHVSGDLRTDVLRRAFRLLGQRHPALRTTIDGGSDGTLTATTHGEALLDLRVLDGSREPGAVARDQVALGLDPTHLPLARADVVEQSPGQWLVVATAHHVAVDDRSARTLVQDLWQVYADLLAGRVPAPLPAAEVETAATAMDLEELEGFWSAQLAEVEPAARLVTDPSDHRCVPAAGQVVVDNEVRFEVPASVARALRQQAASRHATPFMVVAAAVALVQSAHAGEETTCLAVPWSESAGNEGPAHGNETDTVPVPVRAHRSTDAWALVDEVRAALLDGLAHGALPLEEIVRGWRAAGRDGPLFSVMTTWQQDVSAPLSVAGLDVRVEHQEIGTQKCDLTVVARPASSDGWACTVRFDPVTVGAAVAARWADDLRRVLEQVATVPGVGSRCDVVAPGERALLRAAQHRAPGPWSVDDGLDVLVDAGLGSDPDRSVMRVLGADDTVEQVITAGELDRRTRVLQARLDRVGVRPGDRVALVLPRGAELVVAELAVLRAGAAIVPLSTTEPGRRAEEMQRIAGCTALCAVEAPAWWSGPVVSPVDDGSDPGPRPRVAVHKDDVAYVMFTSGSTGTPKGVPVDHASIVNNLSWMQDEWPIGPTDRLLWKTVETFDVSVKEIFWPLLAGAELLVSGPGVEKDAGRISRIVREHRATVVHLVPSLLDVVLEATDRLAGDLSSLRLVMCGAEAVRPDAVRRLQEHSGARLLHLYGPTEAAIAVTGWSGDLAEGAARIPLGRPVPGSRVVVRASDLGEAPRCTVGELWIGGTPIGRGYLGAVRDTAARFLPDPQGPPGSRMYRTGDLGRVREDLLLEFRGRTDDQLKIRGVRVELGEIESGLRALPGVTAAATRIWTHDPEGRTTSLRVVGYVVGTGLDETSVRRGLRDLLPPAMVPDRVVVLEQLPWGGTHKIARHRLPYPEPRAGDGVGAPPRDADLARLWAELLEVDTVHRLQDLGAEGGHSLTAAELSIRIQSDLHRDVSVGDVLGHPVYGDLEDLVLDRDAIEHEPIPVLERSRGRIPER